MPHDLQFTESWPPESDQTRASETPPPLIWSGEAIALAPPGYEILGLLGRGGMGVVHKAKQIRLNRTVALKMILSTGHPDEVRRFLTEAEIIAQFDHPNIVKIHDLGEFQGLPFFALEYCAGGSLAAYLDGRPWDPERAASVVRVLAEAMHYAHAQGVIHRDLKPANVLVTTERPSEISSPAQAVNVEALKITDFGIAKVLHSRSGFTATGSIVGTPSYMAPEQARGDHRNIGPATDVYALGAILYELVTGRPPFLGSSPMETVLQVVEDEPVPPSRFQHRFPRDLETICLKCLSKDSGKRYPNAGELAADLDRFIRGEPIHARSIGPIERAWRWYRRNPTVASLLVLVVFVSLMGAMVASSLAVKAKREAHEAKLARSISERRLLRSEWLLYASVTAAAQREWESGHAGLAEGYLDATRWDQRSWEHRYLFTKFHQQQSIIRGANPFSGVAIDGTRLIASDQSGEVLVWNAETGERLESRASDRERLATSQSSVTRSDSCQREVALLDGRLVVRDQRDGKIRVRVEFDQPISGPLAFNPDGDSVAAVVNGRLIYVWNAKDGRLLWVLKGHFDRILAITYSPDGRWLTSSAEDGSLRIWDLRTGNESTGYWGHEGGIVALAYFSDGRRIATAGRDRTIRIWDTRSPQESKTIRNPVEAGIETMLLMPDHASILVAGPKPGVHIYQADTGTRRRSIPDLASPVIPLRGDRVAGRAGNEVWVMSDASPMNLTRIPIGDRKLIALAEDPDGNRIVGGFEDGTLTIWDSDSGNVIRTWSAHREKITGLVFHPSEPWLASAGQDDVIRIWEWTTGTERATLTGHTDDVLSLAITQDGTRLISGSVDQTAKVWDFATGTELHTLRGHRGAVQAVASLPIGQRILSGDQSGNLRVWEPNTETELLAVQIDTSGVVGIVVSANEEFVYVAGGQGDIECLDARLRPEWLTLTGHAHRVTSVAMSHDESLLAAGGERGSIKVWDLTTGQERFTVRDQTTLIHAVGFDLDSHRLATQGEDGSRVVWDALTGDRLANDAGIPLTPLTSISTDTIDVRVLGSMVIIRKAHRRTPDAEWSRDRLREWAPFDVDWHLRETENCEKEFNWFGAVYHLQQLVANKPNVPWLRVQLAMMHALRNRWPDAAIDLWKALHHWWKRKK